ncbi:odorant receptor 131-2-like [Syngnathus scovelli]|uniref:odorant receptor 131-2-like n=1 Tax=Syngnathus scovelli TaxID=161590 RepID=UPI0021106BE3|nr:odorant receptor 131-2-like [Syngnathus scovelli]
MLPTNVTFWISPEERALSAALIAVISVIFLVVNGVMLFTLRSKRVFRETSRHMLLYNLLLGDTVQLALGLLLYLFNVSRVMMAYELCIVLSVLNSLTSRISPMMLVIMSLERYVAVCHPLRHASVMTVRNTTVAVITVWVFSCLNAFIQGVLMLLFRADKMESLLRTYNCNSANFFFVPITEMYYKVSIYVLFITASLSILFSYVGVVVEARSAATDKHSTHKALNTLLLHLLQLGLCLLSTFFSSIMTYLASLMSWETTVRVQLVLFVCVFLLPRCLSSLIYGLRDENIRVVIMGRLCCHLKVSVGPVKIVHMS